MPEDSAAVTMFRMIVAQNRSLIRRRDDIERLAHARLAENIDYRLLRDIPGTGPINSLTILAEAGSLRRFGEDAQFLKFCGLDLATCQSGISSYPSTATPACAAPSGWLTRSPRDCATTASATSSDDMSPGTRTMPTAAARRRRRSPPRWRVAHAVVKTGTEYRPFLERPDARWKDPSLQVP